MKPRAIVQIAASAWASDVSTQDGGVASLLFALCADGTLWRRDAERGNTPWTQVPPVPEAEVEP